jgi:hypothetical protein
MDQRKLFFGTEELFQNKWENVSGPKLETYEHMTV